MTHSWAIMWGAQQEQLDRGERYYQTTVVNGKRDTMMRPYSSQMDLLSSKETQRCVHLMCTKILQIEMHL